MATACVSLATGASLGPAYGFLTTMPAALAAGGALNVIIGGPSHRGALVATTGIAGAGSLIATVAILLTGEPYAEGDPSSTGWAMAETAALWVLIMLTVRLPANRQTMVAGGLAIVAVPAWLLRFGWQMPTNDALGGFAAWAMLGLTAVAIGWYLRTLDIRRTRSVLQARQAQRTQLARDLHDFVAHDISGMLAQAQAGQMIAEHHPSAAAVAFRRIERAGLEALASMDRAVRMLHEESNEHGRRITSASLADLSEVVGRFSETGGPQVHLEIDPELAGDNDASPSAPRELIDTAHRVVVEALTNIRRHAPSATQVTVDVHRSGEGVVHDLMVTVRNNGVSSSPRALDRDGGLGLPGLTERVDALGGSLTARPVEPAGWMVRAVLPFDAHAR